MSSLGSLVGDTGALFGDTGNYSLLDLVKNKDIQGSLKDLISKYKSTSDADSTDLNSYIKNYLNGNREAETNTGQEKSAVDRFYNGDMASTLAGLRAQRLQAGNEAVNRGVALNRGGLNRALIAGGGSGDNSWANRVGVRTASDLGFQNQLDDINQQRADLSYLTGNQLGLSGRRQALQDALTARALNPAQMRQQNLGWDTSELGNIANVNNSNNVFGTQYNPSMSEKVGSVVGDLGNIAMSAYSGGLLGGGSSSPSSAQMASFMGGAGPVSNGYATSSPQSDSGWSSYNPNASYSGLSTGGWGF